MQGTVSPVLLPGHISMVQKEKIESLVEQHIAGTDIFIVEVAVSVANHISVVLDADSSITIDKCVEISRLIEGSLDREAEDFELEVSSAGLGLPMVLTRQYIKNIGQDVEVLLLSGLKQKGKLVAANEEGFSIEETKKMLVEGKKRKQDVTLTHQFAYSEVKTTRIVIAFR